MCVYIYTQVYDYMVDGSNIIFLYMYQCIG